MGQGGMGGTIVATTPGSVVGGRYLVEKLLGQGGMATVLEVRDLRTDRRLALKILKPEIAAHPEAVERFRREGEFLSSLKHPALITVDAVGTLQDSRLYLAMELLIGETLGERIRRGRLSPTEISPILAGAAVGLDAAHRAGVVHRDLKPDNVFLATSPQSTSIQVKLLDFGISKIDGRASLTRTGQVLGTPRYMAPEQLRGEDDLDARVDVYALGVILYEALAGSPAFPAQAPSDLILAILNGRFIPLRAVRPDVGAELEGVVMRAMSKTREARFANAIELADAWFGVVHRNDGPKGVRPGVATNVLGSVPESIRPPSGFSSDDLRPGTFRDFEVSGEIEGPKPRPLAELVESPSMATPDATSPAHVHVASASPRPRAAALAFEIAPPHGAPVNAASIPRPRRDEAPAAHVVAAGPAKRIDSEPPRLPMTRARTYAIALIIAALVVGAIAIAASMTTGTGAASRDAGIRFVNVPLVFVDAGAASRPLAASGAGASGDASSASPSTKLDASIANATRPVETEPDDRHSTHATTGSTSTTSTSTDSEGHSTTGTASGAEPWTGSTESTTGATGATTTGDRQSASQLLADARAALAAGDGRKCVELASEAIAAGADASVYRVRGDCYRSLGDNAHALRSYQRYCSLAPTSSQIDAVRRSAGELGGTCP